MAIAYACFFFQTLMLKLVFKSLLVFVFGNRPLQDILFVEDFHFMLLVFIKVYCIYVRGQS